jgi:hypothetical protein
MNFANKTNAQERKSGGTANRKTHPAGKKNRGSHRNTSCHDKTQRDKESLTALTCEAWRMFGGKGKIM